MSRGSKRGMVGRQCPSDLPVVMLYNIDPSWTAGEANKATKETQRLASAMSKQGHPVTLASVFDSDIETPLSQFDPEECVLFNWCESVPGIPRSEALVAQIIESLDFTYTGSPAEILLLSENKRRVKRLLRRAGIPTPKGRVFHSANKAAEWECFPAIVKAANEHCSAGMTSDSVVMTKSELKEQVANVLRTQRQPALVEDFIDGREFHISLWGNGTIEMLPPIEVDFSDSGNVRERLCTYDRKFNSRSSRQTKLKTVLTPSLSDEELKLLERTARSACELAGCRDYARIDVRQRYGIFYVLDINPNADITSEDSLALSARRAGYSYGAMGSRLVSLAAQRHPVFGRG